MRGMPQTELCVSSVANAKRYYAVQHDPHHQVPTLTLDLPEPGSYVLVLAAARPKHTVPCGGMDVPEQIERGDISISMEDMMETLCYSNYYTPTKRESVYIPGLLITDWDSGILKCPRCNHDHPDIPHGNERYCPCGLKMQRFGNALRIGGIAHD